MTAFTDARTDRTRLLRTALRLDAIASGAAGAAYLAGAGELDDRLGVGVPALVTAGVLMLVWMAALLYLAGRPHPARGWVWTVIGINAVWAVDSLILVAADWADLTALGTTWTLLQAGMVIALAVTQYAGLRRTT
jgi:hypothetical protein